MLVEEPDLKDLLKCMFGDTEPAAEVYSRLLVEGDRTAKELAQTLDSIRAASIGNSTRPCTGARYALSGSLEYR